LAEQPAAAQRRRRAERRSAAPSGAFAIAELFLEKAGRPEEGNGGEGDAPVFKLNGAKSPDKATHATGLPPSPLNPFASSVLSTFPRWTTPAFIRFQKLLS